MAGKTIEESITARKAAHDKGKKTGSSSYPAPKVTVTVKDVNGKAFTVMVNSMDLSSQEDETTAFAGIVADPLPTATIKEIEYEGWIIIEEEATTTVDWTHNTSITTKDAFLIEPLNQTHHSPLSTSDHPFIINTGATVHISPDKADFLTLHPIQPCLVKSVRGSSIIAVGVGDIKLRVPWGASILLCNALYIPNVAVQLISVGTLVDDSNTIAHFNNSTCWITDKSTGMLIACDS